MQILTILKSTEKQANMTNLRPKLVYFFLYIRFLLVIILFNTSTSLVYSQYRDCSQIESVFSKLNALHYRPIQQLSVLDKRVHKLFIESLDPDGLIFTAADTSLLNKRLIFDDKDNKTACSFSDFSTAFYIEKLRRADSIITICLSSPLNFDENQSIATNSNTCYFTENVTELQTAWTKKLKLRILDRWANEINDSIPPNSQQIDSFYIRAKDYRNEISKSVHCHFNKMIDKCLNNNQYILDIFLNSLTHAFDPHSDYFNLADLQAFEDMLSSQSESFGISVMENEKNQIEISEINPNSLIFSTKLLEEGDIIQDIKIETDSDFDFSCSDIEEITKTLLTCKQNSIELKVRKKDGKQKTILLTKEKISSEQNKIQSYILSGDVKIGYIILPGFYTEFEDDSIPGCAHDLAEVILHLRQEKIEGLILDLSFNGGGSLQEAVELAGIFIDRGPISILEKQNGEFETIRDPNPGTMYDGPLTVLINKASASASEVLAGAFQDYKRALIIGGKSYGKASGQIILPSSGYGMYGLTSQGALKLTIEKIFRINGKTYQKQGIIPDIIFPDYTQLFYLGESDMDFALEGENQTKAANFTPLDLNLYSEIIAKSLKRQLSDSLFILKKIAIDSLDSLFHRPNEIILRPKNFLEQKQRISRMIEEAEKEDFSGENYDFKVKNDKFTSELLLYQKNLIFPNQFMLKSIQNNLFIRETYKITRDLIYSQK